MPQSIIDAGCEVSIVSDPVLNTPAVFAGIAEYSVITPYITDIVPRFGSVEGGTVVTITGNWLLPFGGSYTNTDYEIYMDTKRCDVSSFSSTQIVCTTRARFGLWEEDSTLTIFIPDKGYAVLQGHMFRYVSLWSQPSTWGYAFAPVSGESLSVPRGLHLLVDIDTSPLLNLVIVEGGSIIFPCDETNPNHIRTFDANYIFIHEGIMEVGTERDPYCSKI